jgi:glutathione S-transferase
LSSYAGGVRLLTIPFSHYCEKARWALDRASARYVEEGHIPGFHRFAVRRAGSARTSVPVLVVDGRAIGDSTEILAFADGLSSPERRLFPVESRLCEQVRALENELDETLGPHLRRVVYFHLLPARRTTLPLFDNSTPRWERTAVRVVFPVLRTVMRRFMDIDERTAAESLDKVRVLFDALERRLSDGRPYLTGERFTAADLTLAALAAPSVQPPEHPIPFGLGEALPPRAAELLRETQARPVGAFVQRMYREHRRSATDAAPV